MPTSRYELFDPENQFTVGRLINNQGAAEGTNLPPRQRGEFRVPFVSNLRVSKTVSFLGGTEFTLTWEEPSDPRRQVSHYNIYVKGLNSTQDAQPTGPSSTKKSPALVRLQTQAESQLTFFVQTQLKNGLTSDLDRSPSCTGWSIAALVDTEDFGAQAANSVLAGPTSGPDDFPTFRNLTAADFPNSGVAAATYGSASQVPQITVSNKGIITAAANVTIGPPNLAVTTKVAGDSPYTLLSTDYVLLGNTVGGSLTVNLPASPATGKTYFVKKIHADNTLTLDGNGHTIDGAATWTLSPIYQGITVIYSGSEWVIQNLTII